MAMDADILKAAIKARMTSAGFDLANPNSKAEVYLTIMCEEIITHIINNAEITTTLKPTTNTPPVDLSVLVAGFPVPVLSVDLSASPVSVYADGTIS